MKLICPTRKHMYTYKHTYTHDHTILPCCYCVTIMRPPVALIFNSSKPPNPALAWLLAGVINKIIPMFIFTGCLWLQSVRGTHRSLTAPESGSETRKLSELHRIVVYQNFTRANRVNPCSPKWCLLRSIAKHFIRPQSGPGDGF